MAQVPEKVRKAAYERWGSNCFICGASPPEPTYAQRVRGKTEIRIPLHHLNQDREDHRVENLLPVCEVETVNQSDACHAKIHSGRGRRLHRFFFRRLQGEVTEEEVTTVLRLLAENDKPIRRATVSK